MIATPAFIIFFAIFASLGYALYLTIRLLKKKVQEQ